MVRLFKFIRKDVLTDIGGNIYHLKDIIPILDRLSHFGLTVTPIYVKDDILCEENRKIRKIYNDSYHKRDELYDIIEKKYAGVVEKWNQLNSDKQQISWSNLEKRHFRLHAHYTDDDKEFFIEKKKEWTKDRNEENRLGDVMDASNYPENVDYWEEIICFKFIKTINRDKILVEVVPFLLPNKTESGLKVGDQITINPLDINYIDSFDNVIHRYRDTNNIDLEIIPLKCKNMPISSGCYWRDFKNKAQVIDLLKYKDNVSIATKIKNKVTGEVHWVNHWRVDIIKYDPDKEWFIGLTNDFGKHDMNCYDYHIKQNCLYYFHKHSIKEVNILNWEDEDNLIKLTTGEKVRRDKFKNECTQRNTNYELLEGIEGKEIDISYYEVIQKFT